MRNRYLGAGLVLLIASLASAFTINSARLNSVRVALDLTTILTDDFLARAKAANYNYVCCPVLIQHTDGAYGTGDTYINLRNNLIANLEKVNRYGLRLIPLIPMGSRWAGSWETLRDAENRNIGINSVFYNEEMPLIFGQTDCEKQKASCNLYASTNSWAYEPLGVDKTFLDLLNAIREAYAESRTMIPLEFIHLEHDEPQFLNWCLIGGAGSPCQTAYPYKGNFCADKYSQSDLALINQKISVQKMAKAQAFQSILAEEIHRRIQQVQSICGTDVKVMIYGDSWDDQSWGYVDLWIQGGSGEKIKLSDVVNLPGLTEPQKTLVKQNLVLVLWNYKTRQPRYPFTVAYNCSYAFARLRDKGFKFIYCSAIVDDPTTNFQLVNYADAAPYYANNCLGYFAANWVGTYTTTSSSYKWNVLEKLYNASKPHVNPDLDFIADFGRLIAPVTSIILR